MKRKLGAAERMLKGMTQGSAARKMLSDSNKFAKKLSKKVKL